MNNKLILLIGQLFGRQYLLFFINGSLLGVIAMGLHFLIYNWITEKGNLWYAMASVATYAPLIVVNFLIQSKYIFQKNGLFWKFLVANLSIMSAVSCLAPVCRVAVAFFLGQKWGDLIGFGLASLVMSIPSYFAKRLFVFEQRFDVRP